MRTRFSLVLLAVVVLGFCRVASATVVYDHFDDPTHTGVVDPALWTMTAAPVAGSAVTLTGPAGAWQQIYSTATWDTNTTAFTWGIANASASTDGAYMGVIGSDLNGAYFRDIAGVWSLQVTSASGYANGDNTWTGVGLGDVMGLTRSGGIFTVTKNGVPVSSATLADALPADGRIWLGAVNVGSVLGVDYVGATSTIAPEPSTLVLLSMGLVSLLAYAWRKRK